MRHVVQRIGNVLGFIGTSMIEKKTIHSKQIECKMTQDFVLRMLDALQEKRH